MLLPVLSGGDLDPYRASVFDDFVNRLGSHLSTRTFLADACGSYADVVVAVLVGLVVKRGAKLESENVVRWFNTVGSQLGFPEHSVKKEGKTNKNVKKEEKKSAAAGAAEATPKASGPVADVDTGSADYEMNKLISHLNSLSISHKVHSHSAAFTSDELEAAAGSLGQHTKNLFLKDKKHGLFLVTASPNSDTNAKLLAKSLGLTGANMRMASEDLLTGKLDVKKGCLGPMCILADKDREVKVVVDKALLQKDVVFSHPARNDWSVGMSPTDLLKYIESTGHEVEVVEFAEKGTAPAAGAAKKSGEAPENQKGKGKKKEGKEKKPQQQKKKKKEDAANTLLALQYKKLENFADWYSDVIKLSEMISYYDISGCYILRPWSYSIWGAVQDWFNKQLLPLGISNCYFPMFVSKGRLEKEKDHVEGFAPEVAWVTKSGESDLSEHIAIRPTSETIMYPAFSDWIQSHRDLPLKLNQWSNVVRWEFKNPTPFLRTREFLWQEGHTAHATYEEADAMVMEALELYRGVYEDLMAIPVIRGYKTEKERFAGGYMTTTCEAYIPASGRAIQGATSHNLGQNFGKMFDITFQDEAGKTAIPWQTSWGITTRTIGVMVMVHGDDQGLVLPPKIAPIQVVIVPIVSKKVTMEDLSPYCKMLEGKFSALGLRVKFDGRDTYSPGWKFNHWEQKGVPVRIEVGPRDFENKQARVCIRHSGEKVDKGEDEVAEFVNDQMDIIQKAMFEKVRKERDSHVVKVTEWKDFVPNLEKQNLILTPWCGPEFSVEEEEVKEKSKAEALEAAGAEGEDDREAASVAGKTLCIPFDQPDLPDGTKCFYTGKPAKCWVLWGRSY